MKKLKYLFIFVIMLGLILVPAGCGENNSADVDTQAENSEQQEGKTTLEEIKERGYMVVGLDDTFAPMGFRDENDELIGFDIDMGKEIAKRMGIEEIRWQPSAWEGIVQSLKNKNFDAVINGMTITPEREKEIAFTKPYVNQSIIILVTADKEGISSVEDLKGKVVGTQSGSSGAEAAKKLEGLKEVVEYPQYPQVLMDLKIGRIEAAIIDTVSAQHFMKEQPDTFKVSGYVEEDLYGIGIRKEDTDLKEELDRILQEMKDDGTLREISLKWFKEDVIAY